MAASYFPAAALASSAQPGVLASAATSAICTSVAQPKLAAQMSTDILHALAGRKSVVGLSVEDPKTGINCQYHSSWQFYSASVVKATILAALLHKTQVQRRSLTNNEKQLATLMIEQSDNAAATALWNDTGATWLQDFVNLAKMTNTKLDFSAWGLTLITAADEIKQLQVLTAANKILTTKNRNYELNLMAHVIASERWGVSAGAPKTVTVHLKNGWLPLSLNAWHINSIGAFTSTTRTYLITVLTNSNPTMSYGVTTVERAATAINHDLNPGANATIPVTVRPRPVPGG